MRGSVAILEDLEDLATAIRLTTLPEIDGTELDAEVINSLWRLQRSTLHLAQTIEEVVAEEESKDFVNESVMMKTMALELGHLLQKASALNTLTARSQNLRNAVTEIMRIADGLRSIGRSFCSSHGFALAEWFDAATSA